MVVRLLCESMVVQGHKHSCFRRNSAGPDPGTFSFSEAVQVHWRGNAGPCNVAPERCDPGPAGD